jgi:hypothetical protein
MYRTCKFESLDDYSEPAETVQQRGSGKARQLTVGDRPHILTGRTTRGISYGPQI